VPNHERVVHINSGQHFDVYVGRLSERQKQQKLPDWGNPFEIRNGRSRAECITQHMRYVLERPFLVDKIREELRRKILGCFCDPLACHGTNLAEIADSVPVGHVLEKHTGCKIDNCSVCDQGLSQCVNCGAHEGATTTECPGKGAMVDWDAVYAGESNFICGRWVDASFSDLGERNMPFWCGKVHWVK
jgi:hypothetical protein